MEVVNKIFPKGHACRPGKLLTDTASITIHWVGPYPTQTPQIVRDWWARSGNNVCAHYIIKDNVCWQCIPDDEVAWHCGSAGNYTSIGIEVIPATAEGQFSDASIESLVTLLTLLKKVPLVRHYDWTGKDCPLYYTPLSDGGEERWLALKKHLEKRREWK